MKCEMCFPLKSHKSAKIRTSVVWEVCKRKSQSNTFPIMLYLLRFMMHTMDLEVPLLHIRTPIRQPIARKYDISLD